MLVVALGADYDVAATPGLAEPATSSTRSPGARRCASAPAFRAATRSSASAGLLQVPAGAERGRHPAGRDLRERGVRDDVTIQVVMPFGVPIPPSPATSEAILARFAERGIEFVGDAGWRRWTREERAVLDDGAACRTTCSSASRCTGRPRWSRIRPRGGRLDPRRPTHLRDPLPDVYAVGDVTSVGTPEAGMFAERRARGRRPVDRADPRRPSPRATTASARATSSSAATRSLASTSTSSPRPATDGDVQRAVIQTAAEKADFGSSRRRAGSGMRVSIHGDGSGLPRLRTIEPGDVRCAATPTSRRSTSAIRRRPRRSGSRSTVAASARRVTSATTGCGCGLGCTGRIRPRRAGPRPKRWSGTWPIGSAVGGSRSTAATDHPASRRRVEAERLRRCG